MSNPKLQLEIGADASGAEAEIGKVQKSLTNFAATAKTAGKDASDGIASIGDGSQDAAVKVDRATQNLIGSIQRTTATLEAGGRSSAKYFQLLANQRGVSADILRPYLAQLEEVASRQNTASSTIASGSKVLSDYGMSAKATANALRQVAPQITDVVVSLQAGQKPFTVLLQQGGQLKDVFGGIGPAFRAVTGYIASLINPVNVAIAAIGGLLFVFGRASEEGTKLSKALTLSGNSVGQTNSGLTEMARRLGALTGSQGQAIEALAAFVTTGEIAGQALERVTQAAILFERSAGQPIKDTVAQFAELGRAPLEASLKLNDSLHFLTLETYKQIKALEDQGRAADAAAVAQKAFADALIGKSQEITTNLGYVEQRLREIAQLGRTAFDSVVQIGRAQTTADQLASAQAQLQQRLQRGPINSLTTAAFEKGNQAIKDRIVQLQLQTESEQIGAVASKNAAAQVEARAKFDKDGAQFLSESARLEREVAKARIEGTKAGASQAEIEKRIADIREKFGKTGRGIDKEQLASDISEIKKGSAELLAINAQDEKILEAQHAAGLIDDKDYYDAKADLISNYQAISELGLEQEIKRYERERLSNKEAIANQRKIAAAQADLLPLQVETNTKLLVLSIQQEASAKRLAASFLVARQAAKEYFDDLERAQNRTLAGAGQGNDAREFAAGRDAILDRFNSQKRDLENIKARQQLEGQFTDQAKIQYEERLRILDEFEAKSLESYKDFYAKRRQQDQDASVGASEAIKNYLDEAAKVGKQTEQIVGRALGGLEDQLVSFVTTGKADFKSLIDSMIADLARLEIKALLSKVFKGGGSSGSLFPSFGSSAGAGNSALPDYGFDPSELDVAAFASPAIGGTVSAAGAGGGGHLMSGMRSNASAQAWSGKGDTTVYNVAAGVSRSEMVSALQTLHTIMRSEVKQSLRVAGVS